MMSNSRTVLGAGALGACALLAGCLGGSDPAKTHSAQNPAPLWSVSVRAVGQPVLADGTVVAQVVDPDADGGLAVVAWALDSGEELWRNPAATRPVLTEAGAAYLVSGQDGPVVAVADLASGTQSLLSGPEGWRLHEVRQCRVSEEVCVVGSFNQWPHEARLDTSTMTLVEVPASPDISSYFAEGIRGITYHPMLIFDGDENQEGWKRSTEDLFGPNTGMEAPWRWLDGRQVLLGTATTTVHDVEFDTANEYISGGLAPDGRALWTVGGRPCSGRWSAEPVQALCSHTGKMTQVTYDNTGGGWYPQYTDRRAYVMGIDVRTGTQVWRFPAEGTEREVPEAGFRQFATLGESHLVAWAADGGYLVEVATGKATPLDPDGAFLCPVSVRQSLPQADPSSVTRTVMRICTYDAQPTQAPWPAEWIKLAAPSDAQGHYVVATMNQLVAFQL
ncbi:MAG: hypothetical protein FWE61_09670 [Micrococcales bacterium]|nr:hypothetical protein [Micrococcales bacterium]